MNKVLIVGATSAIAQETAKCFAHEGASIHLIGRNDSKLKVIEEDLKARGASRVSHSLSDLTIFSEHSKLVDESMTRLSGLDYVLIAHGTLPDQRQCELDYQEAEQAIRSNFLSQASLLTLLANRMEDQRRGVIAVITSVAGDRGRQSNYVYASAKGALAVFLSGLRNRLESKGVSVITVKPGYVDTPMVARFKKSALTVSPDGVGRDIYQAMLKRKNVVYVPWFWWGIMAVIKSIPECIFKRMKL